MEYWLVIQKTSSDFDKFIYILTYFMVSKEVLLLSNFYVGIDHQWVKTVSISNFPPYGISFCLVQLDFNDKINDFLISCYYLKLIINIDRSATS